MKGKKQTNKQTRQNPAILLTNWLCCICCLYCMHVEAVYTVVTAVEKWRRVPCYNYFGKQIKKKSIKWKKGALMDCILTQQKSDKNMEILMSLNSCSSVLCTRQNWEEIIEINAEININKFDLCFIFLIKQYFTNIYWFWKWWKGYNQYFYPCFI